MFVLPARPVFIGAVFITLTLFSVCSRAESLRDIYELALKNDATLRAAAATFRANQETEKQARSRLLPQIASEASYSANQGLRDAFGNTLSGNTVLVSQIKSQSTTRGANWNVSLSQALFDLPSWFSFKRGQAISAQATAQFAYDQQQLIIRVAETYFNVLRAQDNLLSSQTEERVYKEQWEQAQSRLHSGIAAITDVHEARAAYDASRAQRITDAGNVRSMYAALSVLTGLIHTEVALLEPTFPIKSPQPGSETDWIKHATQNNFALKAAVAAMNAARQTRYAKEVEHLPKVNASLSYQNQNLEGKQTFSPDSPFATPPNMEDHSKVAAIKVIMPIYSGGLSSSQARQAYEQYNVALEQKIDIERKVMQNTLAKFVAANSDVERVQARQEAINSSQAALEATQAAYKSGTRSIVDVLTTQRTLFISKRDYANARYDYVMDLLYLKQWAGMLSPQDIYELNHWLVTVNLPRGQDATN